MMQFNPLFFHMNQATAELSKPEKFGGVSYLFSDIIKVFLAENEEQNPEEQRILSSSGDQIKFPFDVFNSTGSQASNEKTIEVVQGKKLKLSLNEISDSSVQKVFAGIANAVLQKGTEISVKKGSENSVQRIELNSSVPEDEVIETISLFMEKINENFGMPETEKAPNNAPYQKTSGTIQSAVYQETEQIPPENNGVISSAAGTNAIKFKLESPGELLTLELIKPEKDPILNIGNKNVNIFNSFRESGQKEFKLQVSYSVTSPEEPAQSLIPNLDGIPADKLFYKEPADPESVFPGGHRVGKEFKSTIQTSDKYFSKETSDLKPSYQTDLQIKKDNEPIIQSAGKYFHKETEASKQDYPVNPQNEKDDKSSIQPAEGKKNSSVSFDSLNLNGIKNLKSEIRLKIAIEPKEAPQNNLKPQYREVKDAATIIFKPKEDVIVTAPPIAAKGAKSPAVLSLEISKDKENSVSNSEMNTHPVKENEDNKTFINEGNNKLGIMEKDSAGNQNQYSDQLKHEESSGYIKNKIHEPVSLSQGKEFSSALINEQSQVKDIVQKENPPLPSLKSEEVKIVNYANLNEEISGIIKEHEVKSVVLKLQPEELGKVKVVLDLGSNGIKANIEVGNEAVRQTVQSNIEQLKQNLIHHGIQLSSLNITLYDYNQKPNKTFDQKKLRNSEQFSEEQIRKIENPESPAKKLGYNTYEYLI